MDNAKIIQKYADFLIKISKICQPVVIAGGGVIARHYISHARNFNADESTLDELGIEISRLNDFVMKLPNKSDTFVGESGIQLSGGQKQRIGIARALYKNPDLIIFDEATNALDLNTEVKIYSSIIKELKDKTLIVVTHKKNFHNFSNKIINIEKNKIYEI